MATVTILGGDREVAPYNIAMMRRAAPFIDRIQATAGALNTLAGMTDVAGDFCGVMAIGLSKVDPVLTQEYLEENLGLGDLNALRDAFVAILEESGLVPKGEAMALVAVEAPTGALPTA